MEEEKLELKLKKAYSLVQIQQYVRDRNTHISRFITSQLRDGTYYNQRLQVLYTIVVQPYYE